MDIVVREVCLLACQGDEVIQFLVPTSYARDGPPRRYRARGATGAARSPAANWIASR